MKCSTRYTHPLLSALVVVGLLGLGGCAAKASQPGEGRVDEKCVVSVESTMKMVTFAAPEGLDDGVTSLFFAQMPDVGPGDLVRVDNSAGQGGARLIRVEAHAKSCAEVAQTAGDHHKHH